MPARKAPAARARRAAPRPSLPRLPELEQRQLDLLGLGMVALGGFFGFLVYLHSDGGEAGGWTLSSLRWLLGAMHLAVPPTLIAIGALLVMRPVLPAVRPFRAGGICLFASLCLGLAAGTFGLGPEGERVRVWDPEYVRPRGGMVGEALYWGVSTLAGSVGAHILALFLFLAAVLLLTGASIAGVIRATSDSTARAIRSTATVTRRRPASDELRDLETGEGRVIATEPFESWESEPDATEVHEEEPEPQLELPEPDAEPSLAE